MANGVQYYDEFEDDGLDFKRSIECLYCHNKITVDLLDYEYDTSSYENESGMGPDCVYSFDSGEEIICDKRGAILNVSGRIREYPLGAYDFEDIDINVIEIEQIYIYGVLMKHSPVSVPMCCVFKHSNSGTYVYLSRILIGKLDDNGLLLPNKNYIKTKKLWMS